MIKFGGRLSRTKVISERDLYWSLLRRGYVMAEVKHVVDNPDGAVVSPVGGTARAARSRRAARSPEYARLWAEYAVERRIAQQLIKYRMANGLTQEELARRAGTSHSQISRLESGQHHSSVATLEKIAEALDLDLDITFTPRRASIVADD